ncbi:4-phosphoerythronate dehydrogenase [Halovibrio salipaludis]|uniref:4-phosphoerythronate dehydrogenase n=1 Tax=Halovibrio salipaludis TaxID=2032626 RepID=UPI0018E9ACA0|nr:4-phosphoerythronate dehydrogenase [Halovibrio salipaludis]
MSGLRILADENIPALPACFGGSGEIRTLPGRSIRQADLQDVDVLLVRSVTRVDGALLAGTPVRWVGTATIGTDHLDTHWLEQQGIAWASAPGCNAEAVADYVLAVLALAAVERGQALTDGTVGIVGFGNVGSRVHRRLQALGIETRVTDPPLAQDGVTGLVGLDEVLACDRIALHAPLVRGGGWPTEHLLDAGRIQALRPDQVLISAGRGAVVDNAALRERLEAADGGPWTALDVWEGEPLVDPRLARMVRIATPHIAGYSLEGKLRGTVMLALALNRWLAVGSEPSLEALVPEPATLDALAATLEETLLASYDPRRDTHQLRATLDCSRADRASAFDRLRRDYPVRRELGFHHLPAGGDPVLNRQLEAAGFTLIY